MLRQLLFTLIFMMPVLFFPWHLNASDAEPAKNPQPIHIEANRMESLQEKNTVIFTGKVEARQGDVIIQADIMRVYYSEEGDNGKEVSLGLQKVKKLIAEGHVTVIQEGWIATGDNVEYFGDIRKVILTGNAKIYQDNNMVTGDSVTLFLDEGRSIVKKDSENGNRIKMFIYPESETEENRNQ